MSPILYSVTSGTGSGVPSLPHGGGFCGPPDVSCFAQLMGAISEKWAWATPVAATSSVATRRRDITAMVSRCRGRWGGLLLGLVRHAGLLDVLHHAEDEPLVGEHVELGRERLRVAIEVQELLRDEDELV